MQIGVYLISPPTRGGAPAAEGPGRTGDVVTSAWLAQVAAHAEGLGFDAFWLPDHVVMPVRYTSVYPYQPAPSEGFERYPYDESPFPEPLTALAFVAGATTRIRLATGVLIVPERNPVVLAKQVATLDALSGGRVQLGVGAGWLREEYEALGMSWEHRGRRLDEAMEAMRHLWREEVASYSGEYVSFSGVRCDPKPVQAGGVPLIVGGHSPAAARRAGRLGDGFVPTGADDPAGLDRLLETMRLTAEQAGRDPEAVAVYVGTAGDPRSVEACAGRGVSGVFVAGAPTDLDGAREWLDGLATSVLGPFR